MSYLVVFLDVLMLVAYFLLGASIAEMLSVDPVNVCAGLLFVINAKILMKSNK